MLEAFAHLQEQSMLDPMSMLREFYGNFADLYLGTVGLEDCESLFAHLKNKKAGAGKFSVRHFLAIQQAIELEKSGNVYWIPCLDNPSNGLTKMKSDPVPLLRLLESGPYNPGTLRPLRGVAFCEQ